MQPITLHPIGVIHTPFEVPHGIPKQPSVGRDVQGTVELLPDFVDGLKDMEGFSHITLVFYLHLSEGYELQIKPNGHSYIRGLFTTRGPRRPNPIGISTVRLDRIEGNILHIRDVDMVDGTPLLDIKPCVHAHDTNDEMRKGWMNA